MNRKSLINQLELAYAPLTAYEFAVMKDDAELLRALGNSSLYIIAQRPSIRFEKLRMDANNLILNFEIHQNESTEVLTGKLPLSQDKIGINSTDEFGISFNFLGKMPDNISEYEHITNVHGFSLSKIKDNEPSFIIWFSPEKLLQNWWKSYIECDISGNTSAFANYAVHYVGKATKQSIISRLTGHSTLQDILSLESSVTEKGIIAQEIVILLFEFKDNIHVQTFGESTDTNEIISIFSGENQPTQERIFLDAEKALINCMKPYYNKELFSKYPQSKDGLYSEKYNSISYTFTDPINFVYQEGIIRGSLSPMGGDKILILENKESHLIKNNIRI